MEKIKELLNKIKAWWDKFTSKQKSIIVMIVASVIFAFVLVVYFMSRPQYTRLGVYDTAAQASKVIDILDSAGVSHKESSDGLKIDVETKDLSAANLAIGAAGFVPSEYASLADALSGGLSTTASDKEKMYQDYLRSKLERDLEHFTAVKSAIVNLHIPEQRGTLVETKEESSAYIQLELDGTFTSTNAATVAKAVQTFLGNSNTANIVIVDFDANLLFAGGDDYSTAGIAGSQLELKNQAEAMVANQVKRVLLGTKQFDNIEVMSQLDVDFSSYEETTKEYYANEGREEGMKAHESKYDSENVDNGSAVPGAESNDGTVMVHSDYGSSQSSQSETDTDYLPNENVTYKVTPAGSIKYDDASISIAMIRYKELKEEDAKTQGLLDGTTWEKYKSENGNDVKLEVDPEFYDMVSTATKIKRENITIIAYERPVFYDKETGTIKWTNVFSIVLFVVILALLAFVVLRSMQPEKTVVEEEEELSVEQLLQTTAENELEDIDVGGKSETRRVIEKFVDDNPEAAAALLRNWLNADWA